MWIIELEPGVWRADGRILDVTLVEGNARRYKTKRGALMARGIHERLSRKPFYGAKIYEVGV